MELEQAKIFAQRRQVLEEEVKSYEPSETGYEGESPEVRFEGLWQRLDELAAEAPSYDGINRSSLTVRDGDGMALTVTRSQRKTEGRMNDINIRTITAEWSTKYGELLIETLNDELLRDNRNKWVSTSLGTLEETEAAIRNMVEQHQQLMEHVRLHPISEGHP
jgi:hypothetical protein